NSRDGLHLASLAGTWTAIVAGFGGMRAGNSCLRLAPRLPAGITKLRFRIRYKARRVQVTVDAATAGYDLLEGAPIEITHHGTPHLLDEGGIVVPIPDLTPPPAPEHPWGRAPRSHRQREPT